MTAEQEAGHHGGGTSLERTVLLLHVTVRFFEIIILTRSPSWVVLARAMLRPVPILLPQS